MEGPRRVAGPVPLQVSEHRLHEPHIPPKHRRAVRGPLHIPTEDEDDDDRYGNKQRKTESRKLQQANSGNDVRSGSVCLDVINQTWSPMYDMINIFEAFLPHLLRYPNPSDPLNGEAAALMLRDPKGYESKVRGRLRYPQCWSSWLAVAWCCVACHVRLLTYGIEYVQRYASKDAAEEAGAESEDDDDMSSVGSFGDDDDDEPAGQMDDV